MCGMVMTERGQVLNRTSIFPLSVEDLNNPAIEDRKSTFTGILERHFDLLQLQHGGVLDSVRLPSDTASCAQQ